MYSLAPALTLTLTVTLTLNHLANKQQTTSTLFGLRYPMTTQRTINIFTRDKSVGVTQEPRTHYLLPYFNLGERSDSHSIFYPDTHVQKNGDFMYILQNSRVQALIVWLSLVKNKPALPRTQSGDLLVKSE